MSRWSGSVGVLAAALALGLLHACVGDDPSTRGAEDAGAPGNDAARAPGDDSAPPSADASDAGPDAPPGCVPGLSPSGAFCDDFASDTIGAFWSRSLSADAGDVELFADPTSPSPPGSLRARVFESVPGGAKAAALLFRPPPGHTSVSCSMGIKPTLAVGANVRLSTIVLSTGGKNTRQVVVLAVDGQVDAFAADIVDGTNTNRVDATVTPAIENAWRRLEVSLTATRATVSYAGKAVLDVPQVAAVFDQAVLQVGLTVFVPDRTVASAVRYDDVRCTILPP